ncbi:hypothetical protein A0H76_3064 [Hepatospora eriocheir]|uniref:Uncharacterized protein n=1 Tax=Hepatospora eriocheir TaxID=1081669 RepID=A0A1X0Q721_9MICR|nr:hypothetical protein A0H76_3064 [Hepatospora eriocheir]
MLLLICILQLFLKLFFSSRILLLLNHNYQLHQFWIL